MENQQYHPCYFILQAGESLSRFIQPRYLLAGAEIMFCAAILLIIGIYSALFLKKKKFVYRSRIHNRLEDWISLMVSDESGEGIAVSRGLLHISGNATGRQLLIDELLGIKKNFTGRTARNIVGLYEQLGLKAHSMKKLGSTEWHVKANGIQELCQMDQHDTLKKIYKNINNKNELVRMEAQAAVLHMTGFDGLRFLDLVSYPISEWQQLKLLDQLRGWNLTDNLAAAIPKWLRSPNESVVQLALKLADEYQQFGLHEAIAECLLHPAWVIRSQTINSLLHIANEKTPVVLVAHYKEEIMANRLSILAALQKIGTEDQFTFLAELLHDENDIIKLNSAKALVSCSGRGLALLAENGMRKPDPYQAIYLHVKSEMSL
jgi:hypothetical protein